jgi:hypothetical protein
MARRASSALSQIAGDHRLQWARCMIAVCGAVKAALQKFSGDA